MAVPGSDRGASSARPATSHVFHRSRAPLVAARAEGCWVYDADGKGFLDAAGGAIVSLVGHGDAGIVAAMQSAADLDYAHASVFTSSVLEQYAEALARVVPIDSVRVFPVSGGAESVETAVKLARSYHLARGEDRSVVISRRQSYHGNTIAALRLSGRLSLREPYLPWVAGQPMVPEVHETRCPNPAHPSGCARWHADRLEELIVTEGRGRVAAFIGESIGGATLACSVPPDGYWQAIAEVCGRHGVLVIVDEVMTGFGRTGSWFAIDGSGIQPDIMVSGKGAGSGYWPLGLCMASGEVHDTVVGSGGFVHGFTFSHSPVGAAVGLAVLERIESAGLVVAAAEKGDALRASLQADIGDFGCVGEIRGAGLLIGVEFVSDRETMVPMPRSEGFTERLVAAARDRGLLVYPSTGCADGVDGDAVLLGPPLTITGEEVAMVSRRLREALQSVTA